MRVRLPEWTAGGSSEEKRKAIAQPPSMRITGLFIPIFSGSLSVTPLHASRAAGAQSLRSAPQAWQQTTSGAPCIKQDVSQRSKGQSLTDSRHRDGLPPQDSPTGQQQASLFIYSSSEVPCLYFKQTKNVYIPSFSLVVVKNRNICLEAIFGLRDHNKVLVFLFLSFFF